MRWRAGANPDLTPAHAAPAFAVCAIEHIGRMGVAHAGAGIGLQVHLDERVRMLRHLERIAAGVSGASPTVIAAIRQLLVEAEAALDQ